MVGKENFQEHADKLNDEIKMHLIKQELSMTPQQKEFFELTLNDVRKDPNLIDKFSNIYIDRKSTY